MSFETLILPSLIKVNSRHGMEGAFGIGGGGIITPESEERSVPNALIENYKL